MSMAESRAIQAIARHGRATIIGYAGAGCVGGMLATRLPGWMADSGFTAGAIGLMLAGSRLSRIVVIPVILETIAARGRPSVGALLITATIAVSMFLPLIGLGKIGWLGVELIGPTLLATLISQLDWLSSGNGPSRMDPSRYGVRRSAASAGYAITAVLAGLAWKHAAGEMMIAASFVILVSGCATAWNLADIVEAPRFHDIPPREQGRFAFFMLAAAPVLIQASHGLYPLTPLLWAEAGRTPAEIGFLWGVAAFSEIAFFATIPWFKRHVTNWPRVLLILGGAGATLRWIVLANSTAMVPLILSQTLHALSFGASLTGTLALIQGRLVGRSSARAVGINQGLQSGLFPAVSLGLSGFLLHVLGQQSFLVMAALALAGTFAALHAEL